MSSAPEAGPAAPPERRLGFLLHYLGGLVTQRLEEALAEQGYSHSEYLVLLCMYQEQWVTHFALIRYLGLTKGAISKVLRGLERAGLVERRLIAGSRRRQRLSLTAQGEALVQRLAGLAEANDEHYLRHLQPGQQRALVDALWELANRYAR